MPKTAMDSVVAAVNGILGAGLASALAALLASATFAMGPARAQPPSFETFAVPAGSAPHDVAPAPDGTVWYTAQARGAAGRLDPRGGKTDWVPLGDGAAPHGVIVGPDRAAWITDGGQNAIVRVDPKTLAVTRFPLPKDRANANLNTAVFDKRGHLWFTGQSGIYGEFDPASAKMRVFDAPRGRGPYGICVTPDGSVYFASLAGGYLGRIDPASGAAQIIDPPTPDQGARRVWSDSKGRVWVSEWNAGKVGVFDPATHRWREWRLPGQDPHAYAIFVDDRDIVWLSEWSANALVRFDPQAEQFEVLTLPRPHANVRQMMGRHGEVWLSESGTDHLLRYRSRAADAGSRR
ncbi:membrane protein [Burkholderia oklahomensis]|uniref:Virginiamycin B lyase n=1 Tax=Burkholderia oklahomensis TaxID=342113 RepID=A0AAI8BBF0_9BURK|nr:membrane protein [Burkholderia oklahomensis]AIO68919.1 SMP-30/Gluconolaconase/LRE-like region family protein [Burkholderia oklahomensis]AOI39363.1 lyase [Burkholderia oklahomensis EO147]KUY53730.1 lyase [Burkholderia oklahomensis EO147]QPS40282.1 lyase [Burkholderia oklahomensis]